MRPSLSVAMIASARDCSASSCGSEAPSPPKRSAGVVWVGMISTPVINSALPWSKSTGVELISRRLSWPCNPTISIS